MQKPKGDGAGEENVGVGGGVSPEQSVIFGRTSMSMQMSLAAKNCTSGVREVIFQRPVCIILRRLGKMEQVRDLKPLPLKSFTENFAYNPVFQL